MHTETHTRISTTISTNEAVLTVRHDGTYVDTFRLKIGCVDEWLTIDDLKELHKLCSAGLRKAKAVHK